MTSKENLLIVAIEECSEVAQALTKFMRFGAGKERNNEYDIWVEYNQLKAMFEMLTDKHILESCSDDYANTVKESKKVKVEYYTDYSRQIGIITDKE